MSRSPRSGEAGERSTRTRAWREAKRLEETIDKRGHAGGDGFAEPPETTRDDRSGDALEQLQNALELDDAMLGEVLGVAPGAIEHWRRTGVPEAHADSVVLLRETAERIHAHHRDEAVAVLLRIPIGDCAGRSILDLLRERDGEALDRAFAALQPWTDRPSSARRSAPADVGTSTVAHVMSRMPVTVDAGTSLREAAQRMRDADIGDVIVIEHGRPSAILTDRDIVVRAVAEQRDPLLTRVASIASGPLVAVSPDAPIRSAVTTMRANGLRRLPVLDGGRLVGVVSLGDIAVQRQPESPLASIVGEQRSD